MDRLVEERQNQYGENQVPQCSSVKDAILDCNSRPLKNFPPILSLPLQQLSYKIATLRRRLHFFSFLFRFLDSKFLFNYSSVRISFRILSVFFFPAFSIYLHFSIPFYFFFIFSSLLEGSFSVFYCFSHIPSYIPTYLPSTYP